MSLKIFGAKVERRPTLPVPDHNSMAITKDRAHVLFVPERPREAVVDVAY
jgi:hypothetical protein